MPEATCHYDPTTDRWVIDLPDEPGQPTISARTPHALERLLNSLDAGEWVLRKESPSQTELRHRIANMKGTTWHSDESEH